MNKILFLLLALLVGCGKAEVSGRTQAAPPIDVPLLLVNTDYYIELSQQFSSEISGQIDITKVLISGTAYWSGSSTAQLEMRMALTGSASTNSFANVGTTAPAAWSTATVVFSQTLTGNEAANALTSSNIREIATSALAQQKFWLIVRVRSQGLDVGEVLSLQGIQAYAEGTKSLEPLSPLINLGF